LTLDEAVRLAIENNKELASYSLKVKETEALKRTALSIDKTLVFYGYDQNNIAENGYPLKVIGVEQNFNFPTTYMSHSKANKINILIADAEVDRQKQILTKNVSQSYYEILNILNRQKYYSEIDSLYRSLNNGVELSYQIGDISQLDLLNAKAKQQQINVVVTQLKHDLDIAYRKLQSLIQYDSTFVVPQQTLTLIPVENYDLEANPGMQMMKMRTEYQSAMLKVEQNRLLPDLSLSYFNGTNQFTGSKNYQGFQFGMAVPLFFGGQKARIKANKIAVSLNENLQSNFLTTLNSKYFKLNNELMKYRESIDSYNASGKPLSEEIIRTSLKSFNIGEIDFFRLVLSIENALSLTLDYFDNVAKYNQVALEINYLTN